MQRMSHSLIKPHKNLIRFLIFTSRLSQEFVELSLKLVNPMKKKTWDATKIASLVFICFLVSRPRPKPTNRSPSLWVVVTTQQQLKAPDLPSSKVPTWHRQSPEVLVCHFRFEKYIQITFIQISFCSVSVIFKRCHGGFQILTVTFLNVVLFDRCWAQRRIFWTSWQGSRFEVAQILLSDFFSTLNSSWMKYHQHPSTTANCSRIKHAKAMYDKRLSNAKSHPTFRNRGLQLPHKPLESVRGLHRS